MNEIPALAESKFGMILLDIKKTFFIVTSLNYVMGIASSTNLAIRDTVYHLYYFYSNVKKMVCPY